MPLRRHTRPVAAARRSVRLVHAVAVVLAPISLLVAACSVWIRVELQRPEALDRTVRSVLQRPEVRRQLSVQLARTVTQADSRLIAAEPALRTAAEIVVESRQFAALVELALRQGGRAVVTGDTGDATTLAGIETEFVTVMNAINPSVAQRVPRGWETRVVDLRHDSPLARSLRSGSWLGDRAVPLSAITIGLHTALLASATRRRRALRDIGVHTAAVGAIALAARTAAASWLPRGDPDAGPGRALRAAFDEATEGWARAGIGLLAAGVLIALAATPPRSRRAPDRPAGRAVLAGWWAQAVQRFAAATPTQRLLPAAVALAGAAVLGTHPEAVGRSGVTAIGAAAVFVAARLLAEALPDAAVVTSPARLLDRGGVATAPSRTTRRRRAWQAASIVTTVVAVTSWGAIDAPAPRAAGPATCNGHAELCDRPVDQVTFAGSHNAMASVDAGFLFAQQRATISGQLDNGIRALLVDTHYGLRTTSGVVWTEFRHARRATLEREVGADAVAAVDRLRPSLVTTSDEAEVYLCHAYCELGATPAADGFGAIRRFLERNRREVVLLYVQDNTEPGDTVAALRDAGLDRFAYIHHRGERWPTIWRLIDDGTPLVVLAEQHGGTPGTPAWFHRAFALTQDTPYDARRPAELSCEPNRGPAGAPLLLLNHWLITDPADEDDARAVNNLAFLEGRVQRCAAARGRPVNIIAVNFAEIGDVLSVTDRANGLAPATALLAG
ncbi:MAG: hypothetical protein IT196_20630 [Acidimicrobiales bacterium]|nr:hypothetical protein [Acidimicrobiales bacterium]